MRSVAEFVATPREAFSSAVLVEGLALAAAVELATLPPYLCGYWSIQDDPAGQVSALVKSVVYQEMVHLGLVCNMTTAIGGTPSLTPPVYPGPLPAGLRPGLVVTLQGLSVPYVRDVFMQIEYPEAGPLGATESPTIGEFYDVLALMFQVVDPPFGGGPQQTAQVGGDAVTPIAGLDDALTAITTIKEQGEGTATSPDAVDTGDPAQLAHYYRFGEIVNGREFVETDGEWGYTGDLVPFPETYPMAPVPAGGWQGVAPEVYFLLKQFSTAWGDVLSNLNAAWSPTGTGDDLDAAITAMFNLQAPATGLMQLPVPGGSGTYGPDFLLRP